MIPKTHFHVSDLRQFKNCRIKWYFSSPLRGGWEPKTQPHALHVGSLVHQAIELWYSDRSQTTSDVWNTIWANEEARLTQENVTMPDEEADALYAKCVAILDTYLNWARKNDNLEVLHSEQKFEVPFIQADEVYLAGKMDQIVRDEYGNLWVRDFKVTTADFFDYSEYIRSQDDQVRAYVYALRQLFPEERIGGAIYTFIRAASPTIPEVLKSGKGLSRRANIDTTYDIYYQTILDHGFDPDDYEEILTLLKNKPRPWVMQCQIFLTEPDLALWKARSNLTVRQMMRTNHPDLLWPADYFSCKGCRFRKPCAALLNEGMPNAQRQLEIGYRPSKYALEALDTLETE